MDSPEQVCTCFCFLSCHQNGSKPQKSVSKVRSGTQESGRKELTNDGTPGKKMSRNSGIATPGPRDCTQRCLSESFFGKWPAPLFGDGPQNKGTRGKKQKRKKSQRNNTQETRNIIMETTTGDNNKNHKHNDNRINKLTIIILIILIIIAETTERTKHNMKQPQQHAPVGYQTGRCLVVALGPPKTGCQFWVLLSHPITHPSGYMDIWIPGVSMTLKNRGHYPK